MKIEKVRVFMVGLGKDEAGVAKEGVVSIAIQNNVLPLIAMDDRQYEHFSGMAQDMANQSGKDIWVAEFTERQDIRKFERQLVQPVGGMVGSVDSAKVVSGPQYAKAAGIIGSIGGDGKIGGNSEDKSGGGGGGDTEK